MRRELVRTDLLSHISTITALIYTVNVLVEVKFEARKFCLRGAEFAPLLVLKCGAGFVKFVQFPGNYAARLRKL